MCRDSYCACGHGFCHGYRCHCCWPTPLPSNDNVLIFEGLDEGRDQGGLPHAHVGAALPGIYGPPHVLQPQGGPTMYALIHQDRRLHRRLWLLFAVRSTQDFCQAHPTDEGIVT